MRKGGREKRDRDEEMREGGNTQGDTGRGDHSGGHGS